MKTKIIEESKIDFSKVQLLRNTRGIEKVVMTTGEQTEENFTAVVLHQVNSNAHKVGDIEKGFSKSAFSKFEGVLELSN